jgi:EipB-like
MSKLVVRGAAIMTSLHSAPFLALFLAPLMTAAAISSSVMAQSVTTPALLAPHRAVYDMMLDKSRSGSSVSAVKGRMVYELTGSACEGYTQSMRFVTEMSSGEGAATTSDLRSSSWENATATKFRFNSTQLRDDKAPETTSGDAKREKFESDLAVSLSEPEKKSLSLGAKTYFPVQHSIALLEAAKAGKPTFRADLYDGSEQGQKVYDTNSLIGGAAKPAMLKSLAPVKNAEKLSTMTAWPVSISYYELGAEKQDAVPVYELGFLYYENGVSRRLVIDYGEFAIRGELTEITFFDPGKCDAPKR